MSREHAALRARIAEAAKNGGNQGPPRQGLVTSYDPVEYAVKLQIMPPPAEGEAAETNWIPIMAAWVGAGFGLAFGPAVGDQMLIVYPEGDDQGGVAIGANFSDVDTPMPVPSGEAWLVHKDGAEIKMLNDGTITSKGRWLHDGDFEATGDVLDQSASNGATMKVHRDDYNAHKHGGVQTGSGVSGVTDTPAS